MECRTSTLVLDDISPNEVASAMIESGNQKQPFYIFDMDEAYNRIMYFKENMPRVNIFYAMKANDCDKMLKLVVACGLGFDCASPGEIHKVLQLNVNPLSIIFAVPTKPTEWMTFARDSGIRHTTFDSSYELRKLKQLWPDAKLLIRIKADGDSIYKLGEKFGCDFETEAINLLEEAASLNLEVVGVAFHVGSSCSSIDSHVIGLQRAKTLFEHEERAGRHMGIVDIGGGFLSDLTNRIDQVSQLINKALEELFPDPNIQVIAEPGRYICDSSCTLYCNINNIRKVKRDNEQVNMLYLSDGIFGTLKYTDPWHTVHKFERQSSMKNEALERTILWGPTCDSADRVMQNMDILLPSCTLFDWLVFPIQGGYTFGFHSNFSCLEKPQIRSVLSRKLWNEIKHRSVFNFEDFIEEPDIAAPLASTLPQLLLKNKPFSSITTLKL